MSASHVHCPKCNSEVAADIEKCPNDGTQLPKSGLAELIALEARGAALDKAIADRKAAALKKIADLEKEVVAA
jgi:hypothetical protein